MFGSIELVNFTTCKLEQEAASAWSATNNLVGASYKPLLYLGKQQVNGVNYFFIAEQTVMVAPPLRRVVKLTICKLGDEYKLATVDEV